MEVEKSNILNWFQIGKIILEKSAPKNVRLRTAFVGTMEK